MAPVTRRQSEHSVIDLTEDDLLPESPPRPTIASRRMAPRRALRSGSTSTTTSTLTRTSGSRTEGSTMEEAGSTGQLTRSSSGSSIVALEEPPEGMILPAAKRQKLNKGKGRATSADILTFDEDDERRMLGGTVQAESEAMETEGDAGVIGEPEENLLASFRESDCSFRRFLTRVWIAEAVESEHGDHRMSHLPCTSNTSCPYTMWSCQ
jgi:hypothetical protein